MWKEILIISAIFLVLSVVGILLWWKLADQWVDEEHKRFKRSGPAGNQPIKTVIRNDDEDAAP